MANSLRIWIAQTTCPYLGTSCPYSGTGFEQSGQHCRSRHAKGILFVTVTHSYQVPSCDSRVRLQRESAADKAEERAQQNAVRQPMRAENANPRVRSGAAQGGSLAPPLLASQSSAASSASFASILSAPSIQARQPLTPLHMISVRISNLRISF